MRRTPPMLRPSRSPLMLSGALAMALALPMAPAIAAGPMEAAQAAEARGDIRAAQAEWRNAVRATPDSAAAHAALARTSIDIGDTDLAEREARTALQQGIDPLQGNALLYRSYLASARYEQLLRDFPEIQAPADQAAQRASIRAQAQLALGQKDAAAASAALAERLAPGSSDALMAASGVALVGGDRAKAEALLDQLLARDPNNSEALLRKGGLQFERRDLAAATATFGKVIAQSPGNVAALLRRGEVLFQQDQQDAARKDIDAALAVLPGSSPGIYLRALILARAENWQAADADLQRLGPQLGNFPDGYLVQATVKRGLGQMAQAEDAARRHVARQPTDPRGAKLLAALALSANRPDDAAATLEALKGRGTADAEALDLLARVQVGQGRARDAADTLKEAAKLAPDNAGIQTRLAAALLTVGDTQGVTQAANRAIQLGATGPENRQLLAFAALARGDIATAKAEVAKLTPEQRSGESGGMLEGTLQMMQRDLPAARAAFQGVLNANANSNAARVGLARVATLEGKPAEAEALLVAALKQQPTHAEALSQLGAAAMPGAPRAAEARKALEEVQAANPGEPALALTLANAYLRANEAPKAVAVLSGAPLRAKLNPALSVARAEALAAAGQWKEAEDASRQALAEVPDSVMARRQLASIQVHNGDAKGAEVLLQQGLRMQPADAALQQSLLTVVFQSQGFDPAAALADRLSKQASAQPASLTLPGDLRMSAKRPEDAAKAYVAAYREAPSSALALRQAVAWRSAGKPDQASAVLNDWLGRTPNDTAALVLMSDLDIQANRLPDAERRLRAAIALAPQDVAVVNNLAWVAGERGLPDARALAERAYFLAPNSETADTLGWIMVRTGDAAGAVPLLKKAAEQRATPDPAATYRLSYALNAAGAKQEALATLEPVVASNTAFPQRADAVKLLSTLRAGR